MIIIKKVLSVPDARGGPTDLRRKSVFPPVLLIGVGIEGGGFLRPFAGEGSGRDDAYISSRCVPDGAPPCPPPAAAGCPFSCRNSSRMQHKFLRPWLAST